MDSTSPEPAEVHDLARESIRLAIARWDETKQWASALDATQERDDPSNKWNALAVIQACDAERHLVAAILATDEQFRDTNVLWPEKDRWPARGVRIGGQLYLAIPDPNREDDGGESADLMRLTVVDAVNVLDLDGAGDLAPLGRPVEPARPPIPATMTQGQEQACSMIKRLGERETLDRLCFSGPYGIIHEAIQRLGTDAVAELRKLAAVGLNVGPKDGTILMGTEGGNQGERAGSSTRETLA